MFCSASSIAMLTTRAPSSAKRRLVASPIPLGRHARPDEIAALYAFLASNEGAYFTGATISIDGGETA